MDPDPNDPLDRLILQELTGDPVLFDQWLDAMDELADEPSCEEILQGKGLLAKDVLRNAKACRQSFHARMTSLNIPVYDRFALCQQLAERARSEPSAELLDIFCGILCDPGFLLDHEARGEDPDDQKDIEEQTMLQYISFLSEREKTMDTLTRLRGLSHRFAALKKQKGGPALPDCPVDLCNAVFQTCMERLDMPEDCGALLENLEFYMQTASSSPELRAAEPLLLFLLMTRHRSRMCGAPGTHIQMSTLWQRHETKIDANNGRNFKTLICHLRFFSQLCRVFEREDGVDLPLCWYGLDQVTSLGDFYRQSMDATVELPFPPSAAELVEDAVFSCFENGHGDNVLLADSGARVQELEKFECRAEPRIVSMLEQLSNYINEHGEELAERFIGAPPPEVRAICAEILNGAKLRRQPQDTREVALLLASINGGLMELQDYFARQHLIEAGQALVTASGLTG